MMPMCLRQLRSPLRTARAYRTPTRCFSKPRDVESSAEHVKLQFLLRECQKPLKKRTYMYTDLIHTSPTIVLRRALQHYLPEQRDRAFNVVPRDWLHSGYQHVYFRPALSAEWLCSDGTDIKFLPGPESIWKYRLWAGGSVHYQSRLPFSTGLNRVGFLHESVHSVDEFTKDERLEKIMVTIKRQFKLLRSSASFSSVRTEFQQALDRPGSTEVDMVEMEKILFLRDPPKSFQDDRRIKPPADALHTHTTTPTRELLFQFSALTYNAHSIHLDRESARKDYGAQDLVVHGPLTLVMMLEFLRISVQRTHQDVPEGLVACVVQKSIEYANLKPLYVDQPMTLCCKPSSPDSKLDQHTPQSWQVWIQTGEGPDTSCAVRATAVVEMSTFPRDSTNERQRHREENT